MVLEYQQPMPTRINQDIPDTKQIPYIFSKSAFTSGLQEKQKQGEVTLVTLEEIYKNR